MTTKLFNPRFYYAAVGLVAALFIASLFGRHLHFDDAWSGEQAFWLRRDGYVHSELFRGFGGWENRLYIFHKGYIYAMAAILSVLGESVWAVKTTALLFAVGGLLLLLRYFQGQAEAQWLAALLYLGCGTLMLFCFDGRPETMVMFFGLASYLVLNKADSPVEFALAGSLAGLAGLTHPNGVLYMAAGALWLMWSSAGWRPLGWFSIPSAIVLSVFGLDAALAGEFPLLVSQFLHYPVVGPNLHWMSKLSVMADYHSLFFHSEGEATLSVLLILISLLALLNRAASVPRISPALRYVLLLVGLFWVLTKSPTAYYFLLFVPFFCIVIVETALTNFLVMPRPRQMALLVLLALYPLGSVARFRHIWRDNHAYPLAEVENARLAAYMPRHGAKIIAPLDFIFGQFENYQIRGLTYLAPQSAPLSQVFQQAAADSVAYIITDYRTVNDVYHIPPDAPARIGQYQRVYQDEWHGLYTRQPSGN